MEKTYTVTELNQLAKGLLEHRLGDISLTGEISNLAIPRSGHWYFTLKDEQAQIRCAIFRHRNRFVRFTPEDGETVIVHGKVSLYEPRGDYQFIIEAMEAAGAGALQYAFERLKKKLLAEGLFDESRKKPIEHTPKKLGVITSPSGAAIRDILHVLQRRFPLLPVIIYPVPVQGETAAAEIANTIALANTRKECDVLLVARGGGSIEDLWAFNEEITARAIAASELPIVTGIGHETDYTMADFVADLRAPTPSAAAELLSPDQFELRAFLQSVMGRLETLVAQQLQQQKKQVFWLEKTLRSYHPRQQLQTQAQKVDELEQRLNAQTQRQLSERQRKLSTLEQRLAACKPTPRISQQRENLQQLRHRLENLMQQRLNRDQRQREKAHHTLQALSPLATLERGYSVLSYASNGKVIKNLSRIKTGTRIKARLKEGQLSAEVTQVDKP